jgi:RimJ/RimL family protein N-acetyltransferase/DNA-binding CsgD family transcriptional regulator
MPSAQRATPTILSDGVVTLRTVRPDDADDVTQACQDPQTQLWTMVPSPYSMGDARTWITARSTNWWEMPSWVVNLPGSERFCGSVALRPDKAGGADVGYLLAPWARGHGHATRALRLACAWGFNSFGLAVVTWSALVGNEASRETARAVGFDISDHVFRGFLAQRGERRDAWIGTLTPEALAAAARHGYARSRYLGPELTRRELDILRHLTLGQPNRTIAAELGISENTVKNHVRSILEKLQAKSRSEAVVVGLRQGLTVLSA